MECVEKPVDVPRGPGVFNAGLTRLPVPLRPGATRGPRATPLIQATLYPKARSAFLLDARRPFCYVYGGRNVHDIPAGRDCAGGSDLLMRRGGRSGDHGVVFHIGSQAESQMA